jgi:hypothetical protein
MRLSDPRGTPLAPTAVAGIVLLVVGTILLLTGGAVSLANPAQVDLWVIGVGVLLLLGALLAALLGIGVAETEVVRTPATEVEAPAPEREVVDSRFATEAAPAPATIPGVPFAEARPRAEFSVASSIPAQFDHPLRAPTTVATGPAPWEEGVEPGISLPFSAVALNEGAVRSRYGDVGDESLYPPAAFLEQEVERLREKVRILEQPDPGPWGRVEPDPPPTARSVAAGPRPPEPPSLDGRNARRACAGCGNGLPGGATDPLCWGCGRPLCATCYWRTKEGSAPHTCPSCYARANGSTPADGRPPSSPLSRSSGAAAATPRR